MNKFKALNAVLAVFIFSTNYLSSQVPPTIATQRACGGSGDDGAFKVILTPNNKFLIAGFSASNNYDVHTNHGNEDFWIFQLDSTFALEKSATFGGSLDEEAFSIINSFNGGYIVIGETISHDGDVIGMHGGGGRDIWVVKIDTSLSIEWSRCYGGTLTDNGYDIICTSDSGYLITGAAGSFDGDIVGNQGNDFWICKINAVGSIIWSICQGGYGFERPANCVETFDGNFLITGLSTSNDTFVTDNHGGADSWVVKLDHDGNKIWAKSYGGSGIDNGIKIIPTQDMGFYLVSTSSSQDGDVFPHPGNAIMWLLKADSTGSILWQKCYGEVNEAAFDAIMTSDGGLAMVGFSSCSSGPININHGFTDFAVIKVDGQGNFEWGNAFGGSESDEARSLIETSNHNLVLVGHTLSSNQDVVGFHPGINFAEDAWAIQLSPLPLTADEKENAIMNYTAFQDENILRVKFFSKIDTHGSLLILDIYGKIISEENIEISKNINFQTININGITSGLYILQIRAKNLIFNSKIIIN